MQNQTGRDFLQTFPKYTPTSDEIHLMSSCRLFNIMSSKESRELKFDLFVPDIKATDTIPELINKIKETYKIKKITYNLRLPITEFKIPQNYEQIIKIAINKIPLINGLLKDSSADYDEHKRLLTVNLQYDCRDVIYENNINTALQDLISDIFSNPVSVTFINDNTSTFKEKYEKTAAEKLNELVKKQGEELEEIKKINAEKKKEKKALEGNAIKGKKIYGKGKIFETFTDISEFSEDSDEVCCEGEVFGVDSKTTKDFKHIIFTFCIYDGTGSIMVKIFSKREKADEYKDKIKNGCYIAIRGTIENDRFLNDIILKPSCITEYEKIIKTDESEVKRIELHAHTNMSAMDAIPTAADLVKRAAQWGHSAVAITDHGVVQSYPEAHIAGKKNNIKIIYGLEGYLTNDTVSVVTGIKNTPFDGEFIVFDVETTGLYPARERMTEIGAVLLKNGAVADSFDTFINPERPIPHQITELTNITDAMVKDAPLEDAALRAFISFCSDRPLVAHNASFDMSFIKAAAERCGIFFNPVYIDTVPICRYVFPDMKSVKLSKVASKLNVIKKTSARTDENSENQIGISHNGDNSTENLGSFHRADYDAGILAEIFIRLTDILKKKGGIDNITQINGLVSALAAKKERSFHVIILVKNKIGLKNLYKLVSISHLSHFYSNPRIPRKLLEQHREGLLIGSACEAGELYKAVFQGKSDSELEKIANFYDYLEVQPLGNNNFMIRENMVSGEEDLININKKIISLGKRLGKPVVATGDVHFLDEKDEIYRRILMAGMKYSDADLQPPLYMRTTQEMLDEFSYLDAATAYKIVVDTPNMISEMIEEIEPIPSGDLHTPEIEGADEDLVRIVNETATKKYGNPLPTVVKERIDKELGAIIKHKFAVLYIIAQKLVAKSNSDGYCVGSRGSVGSTFVATMAGISEVNPLPPHYFCEKCHYSEFFTDGSIGSGYDLPEKACPDCGEILSSDGHDIPFETFLGFKGEKSPDIDLNFSGEYQSAIQKYTEELLGEGQVFRAGTISTVAEKTAAGFVKKYLESREITLNNAEVQRLIDGCTGIKKTTGQHPGGMIVIPKKYEVYDFCPVQRPADDSESGVITTHFAYDYLHETVLKLDNLGHDAPTRLKHLEDMTGIKINDIPMNDKSVMKLFTDVSPLGIKSEDIGCEAGTLALPEMGTKTSLNILLKARPQTFADLLQVSGLSHGEGIWEGNAAELIKNGTCTISEVVGTRDNIMLYLINKGVEPTISFKITESVRKGKGVSADMEQTMVEHEVPEWYIDSCKKIQYMFPKAHAAAYVMAAIRLGYYKLYYPLEFYCSYFTVKPGGFDAEIVMAGHAEVNNKIREYETSQEKPSQKDEATYKVMQLVREALARGIEFLPVDLYLSHSNKFLVEDNKIRMPLSSFAGVGENAAAAIENVRDNILSIDELRIKAGLSKTVIETLENNGILKGMDKLNQISLF